VVFAEQQSLFGDAFPAGLSRIVVCLIRKVDNFA
jgi:hypothetical protein